MHSVIRAAEELKEKLFAINVLISNAGGAFVKKEFSKDGLEMTFAVNHLGHFQLTESLMPLLKKGRRQLSM